MYPTALYIFQAVDRSFIMSAAPRHRIEKIKEGITWTALGISSSRDGKGIIFVKIDLLAEDLWPHSIPTSRFSSRARIGEPHNDAVTKPSEEPIKSATFCWLTESAIESRGAL